MYGSILMKQLTNNECKEIAKLKQKKYRTIQQKVIIEGKRTISQLIQNDVEIHSILLLNEEDKSNFYSTKQKIDFVQISKIHQQKIASTKAPQNCFAIVSTKSKPLPQSSSLICYLDGIQDPGNLGTIIRTIAAAGFDGLVLSPNSCDVFNDKTIRSAMGLIFSFPIEIRDHNWLLNHNYQTIVTTLNDAENLFDFDIPQPSKIALIIGSEAHGVSVELEERANYRIQIPQENDVESLNAGVATAICAFEIKRQLYSKLK
jgi:TrmH family RNA methyltransferase